jgi:hypothetical protein
VLNSLGFIPWRYFRAQLPRRIDRDVWSDREVHALQQSCDTIESPTSDVNHTGVRHLPKCKQRNDVCWIACLETSGKAVNGSAELKALVNAATHNPLSFQARQSVEPIHKESRSGFAPETSAARCGWMTA